MRRTSMPRTPAGRLLAAVTLVASLALVAAAQRDLLRRPADQVRGAKWLWRLASLNALGALAYLGWGRRRS